MACERINQGILFNPSSNLKKLRMKESLNINLGKTLSNAELKSLKGGTEPYHCWCCVYDGDWTQPGATLLFCGDGWGQSQMGCNIVCNQTYNPLGFSCNCI